MGPPAFDLLPCSTLKWQGSWSLKTILAVTISLCAFCFYALVSQSPTITLILPQFLRIPRPEDEWRFPHDVIDNRRQFRTEMNDVMVHLHIPKTGGSTFGSHLLNVGKCPGNSSDRDFHPMKKGWLFARYTLGWPCGVHPGLYDLQMCNKKQFVYHNFKRRPNERNNQSFRYLYVTTLRSPENRLLSEYGHIHSHKEWQRGMLHCNHRADKHVSASLQEGGEIRPNCLIEGKYYKYHNISLKRFLNCENNYAVNRQVTMLANLSNICPPFGSPWKYTDTGGEFYHRWDKIVESAKDNLLTLAYFGLTEHQELSAQLFEWTFGLAFDSTFKHRSSTNTSKLIFPSSVQNIVQLLSKHEKRLYEFAELLFFKRVEFMRAEKTKTLLQQSNCGH